MDVDAFYDVGVKAAEFDFFCANVLEHFNPYYTQAFLTNIGI